MEKKTFEIQNKKTIPTFALVVHGCQVRVDSSTDSPEHGPFLQKSELSIRSPLGHVAAAVLSSENYFFTLKLKRLPHRTRPLKQQVLHGIAI
jgi:hypothetical protein